MQTSRVALVVTVLTFFAVSLSAARTQSRSVASGVQLQSTSSSAPTTRAPTEAVQPNARRKIKAYTLPPDLYKKAHNLNRIRFRLALIGFVYAQLPDVGRSFS